MNTEEDRIRISCAALCRIEIGGKFLFEVNKNRGNILTPIGGALEFEESEREFLLSLGAEFQKGMDLRLMLPADNLDRFREWFIRKEGRETDPLRELREELIEEHGVLPSWPTEEPACSFLKLVELEEASTRKDQQGVFTHYFYEIFSVELPESVAQACADMAEQPEATLHLLSRGESAAASSHGALLLAETSRIVLSL